MSHSGRVKVGVVGSLLLFAGIRYLQVNTGPDQNAELHGTERVLLEKLMVPQLVNGTRRSFFTVFTAVPALSQMNPIHILQALLRDINLSRLILIIFGNVTNYEAPHCEVLSSLSLCSSLNVRDHVHLDGRRSGCLGSESREEICWPRLQMLTHVRVCACLPIIVSDGTLALVQTRHVLT